MRPRCLPAWSRPTLLSLAIALLALPFSVAGDQPAGNSAQANGGTATAVAAPAAANKPADVDYLTQIRPILSRACYN
ncbi:MAG: hypothetical protein ACKOFW_03985, partial [Planctomycetaceae bacterium]